MLTIFGALTSAAMVAAWSVASSAQGASRSSSSGVVVIESNFGYQGGQGAGTGMVLTSDGEILTNNHVVNGATTIRVIVPGTDKSYSAKVVGYSVTDDVAVIKASGASGLDTISPGDSSKVAVGDAVTALGNAGGTGSLTPAQGHVTGLDQTITASEGGGSSEQLTGMIQSDAPIQPGDSGGAIVNSSGQVVGMITAGDVQGFRSQTSTVNYSVPSDTATSYVNRIRSGAASAEIIYGQVGFMGVSVRNSTGGGAQVVTVQPGSPADSAGITPGAVISKVGGTSITSIDSCQSPR